MSDPSLGTALITGASSGIGAIYADRLAKRGYDLILVARNDARLKSHSDRLANETGRTVKVLPADLGDKVELAKVEATLRDDPNITMLVNNAGTASVAPLLNADIEKMGAMIALNITALTRLTYAAAPAFVARGAGTIINIASVVGISPETLNGVYGATKAYVLALSHSLQHELAGKAIRIQAVLRRDRDRSLGNRRSPLQAPARGDRYVCGRYGRCSVGRARPGRAGYDSAASRW
jgi:short-subunit dehydrogenase